jgi:transcriptional regulator with XRE-family HTH domain
MGGASAGEPPMTDGPVSDDLPTLFGKNLREARIKANLTQAQVAEWSGLTQQYVSLVEAGHQNITLGTMTALAKVVDQDVRTLLRKGRGRRPSP